MKNLFIILSIIYFQFYSWGQESIPKDFQKQLDFAKELILENDYKTAVSNLSELYLTDTNNTEVSYYLGYAYFFANRTKSAALPYLLKGASFNGNAYYFIGIIYHQQKIFNLALKAYNNYKSLIFEDKLISNEEVNKQINKTKTAKELLKNRTILHINNLGSGINSPYPDYAPVLFDNGNKLFFTSRRYNKTSNKTDPNGEYFEDIYYSEKINKKWRDAINVGSPINTETHDAAVAISSNDSILYIYRANEVFVGGNIFESKRLTNIWSKPQIFKSSINGKTSVESSISIATDNSRIYFSSDRKGGYGGKDIYFVQKLPNGTWSLPINIGGMINTKEDEDGPFISKDGNTLYFSSKGHKNMGGYDLFKSKLQDNGQWSEPENMGVPINSVMDDIFITTVNDNDFYFSSNREGGYGFSDIYHTVLPQIKNDYIVIKGRIIDNKTLLPLKASILLFNENTQKLEAKYESNSSSGKFIMLLNPTKKYKMFVEAENYYEQSSEIDLNKKIELKDVRKTIRLIKKNTTNSE